MRFEIFRQVEDYSPATRRRVLSVLNMLKPFDCRGMTKRRFGRCFDGGYVMADDFDGVSTAYSLGISDDVSWDIDIANIGIDVYQYDHTIDGIPEIHPRFKWKKIGVSVGHKKQALQTLDQVVAINSHDSTDDLILKCDIEGDEWKVFSEVTGALMKRFRQIVVEVHAMQELASSDHTEIMRRAIFNLTANHHLIHVHANNFAPWAILGSIPVPSVLELTLLRTDRGDFLPSATLFPTELDMPNNPDRPDFPLGRFCFEEKHAANRPQ